MSIVSKLISFFVTAFTFWASLITPSVSAPVPEIKQDDFVPVMRFIASSVTPIYKLSVIREAKDLLP